MIIEILKARSEMQSEFFSSNEEGEALYLVRHLKDPRGDEKPGAGSGSYRVCGGVRSLLVRISYMLEEILGDQATDVYTLFGAGTDEINAEFLRVPDAGARKADS